MANPPPAAAPINGATNETLVPFPGSKRQRRPSVRLGDIGEQPAAIPNEPYVRRSKQWKLSPSSFAFPPSKTRPITNLAPSDDAPPEFPPSPPPEDRALVPVDDNLESLAAAASRGGRAVARRIRTAWASKVDEGSDCAGLKSSGGEDAEGEGCREFDDVQEDSECSPDRRAADARVRVSNSRDEGQAADVAEGETDGGDWNNQNERWPSSENGGVRSWLNRLGLGRYAPVFEIHEVDGEVLPLLTLEDLKDMGVNAVGPRRKMYCAIQELRKGST